MDISAVRAYGAQSQTQPLTIMTTTYAVNVSGIAPSTTEAQLHDFFTFCGKISSIDYQGKTAVINFEKPSAAKTALMLNGGTLDGATLSVTSDVVHEDEERSASREGHPIEQTDKPRAGIVAEILAKGYILSDHILQQAIEIDAKQGISKRFLNYIHSLDTTLGARALGPDQTISGKLQTSVNEAVQQAKAVDEQKGFTKTATDYYAKAIASPFGQKVRAFYTTTSKQVQDIHEEARRLAEQHKAEFHKSTSPAPAAEGSSVQLEPVKQAAPADV
ncbi:Protein vip1 [Hypsizygus marmoreus]|uniref:Protein vip1 n=1 Tax=Hypsizygus marmoreus TaxID=39966 RepID=A0A369JBA9_HYPMA|nr:Protein vip1 [Hypsizygus marmoreus]